MNHVEIARYGVHLRGPVLVSLLILVPVTVLADGNKLELDVVIRVALRREVAVARDLEVHLVLSIIKGCDDHPLTVPQIQVHERDGFDRERAHVAVRTRDSS